MEILSKNLSETEVNKRNVVPMKYFKMKRFPKLQGNYKVYFAVKDESGQDHTLCCCKRKLGMTRVGQNTRNRLSSRDGFHLFARRSRSFVLVKEWLSEEQDERGSMMRRIKVEKRTSPAKPHCSPVKNQNLKDGNKGSTTNNGDTESTATFQPFGKSDLGGTYSATSSSIGKEQKSTSHSTSQDVYTTEKPSVSLSLELTKTSRCTDRRIHGCNNDSKTIPPQHFSGNLVLD